MSKSELYDTVDPHRHSIPAILENSALLPAGRREVPNCRYCFTQVADFSVFRHRGDTLHRSW